MLSCYYLAVPSRMPESLDIKKKIKPDKEFICCKPASQVISKIDCNVLTWVLL